MKSRGRAGHNRNLGFLTWFYPGMHVKRWLLLMIFGVALFGLGVGYFLRELYITYTFPQLVYYLTLQFIPRIGRGILFIVLSTGAIGIGVWGFNRSLLSAFLTGSADRLVDIVYQHRYGRRGPKVVAIGGGTGLSVLLRGLKEQTDNLTAIVTVADDGGSSGRLRKEMGVLPPGDFRNCIAALADAEPLMTRLLQYRFSEGSGLDGHSFGNLFIVAMSGVVGNFEEAIRETSRVLAVRGQILPSTPENVILTAEIDGQETVRGESNIPGIGLPISRVSLEPADVPAHVDAVQAILDADMIILGPGSLYTSVLPNLLVQGITEAIRRSNAVKVYVCNVATQHGETDGFSVEDHADALIHHVGEGLFQHILVHNPSRRPVQLGTTATSVTFAGRGVKGVHIVAKDVVSAENPLHHDPEKLSQALLELLSQGPLSRDDSGLEEPAPDLVVARS